MVIILVVQISSVKYKVFLNALQNAHNNNIISIKSANKRYCYAKRSASTRMQNSWKLVVSISLYRTIAELRKCDVIDSSGFALDPIYLFKFNRRLEAHKMQRQIRLYLLHKHT